MLLHHQRPALAIGLFARSMLCAERSVSSLVNRASLFSKSTIERNHYQRLHPVIAASGSNWPRFFSTNSQKEENVLELGDDACPQGIQGDDCVNFKLWLDNCRRYGLANCNDQLQGIQSGKKTIAEVMAEQEKLIEEIAAQYRAMNTQKDATQGVQEGTYTAFPSVNSPCPQGVQGENCERFKLWLENCHRFGVQDCIQQLQGFKEGRKSLAEIFTEQDKMIRDAAAIIRQQRRTYSTSAGEPQQKPSGPDDKEEGQLTQRQKLQRAVKEYGSTVIVFHVTISLMSLGFFYLLVSSGLDVAGFLMKLEIGGDLLKSKLAAGTGTFVVAYAVHKVFAPVRIAITLTSTPFIVRYLRQIGFLKAPRPKS